MPPNDIPDLEEILREMIETLSTRERKVPDKEGRDYSLRARPYRTTDNKIDGRGHHVDRHRWKEGTPWRQSI
jgi:hypothetical protein